MLALLYVSLAKRLFNTFYSAIDFIQEWSLPVLRIDIYILMSEENSETPLITVFMAAYNASSFIGTSIESVLRQSYPHFELLIVDDGSTDNTSEIVRRFSDPRIRLIENGKNKGLPFTRNVALTEAKGEFLAVLDADDIAFPDRLEIQLEQFKNQPRLAVLGGHAYIIDNNGHRTGESLTPPKSSDTLRVLLLFTNVFVHSTVMMRTAALREVGGYPNHPVAQDYGLFARMGLKYEVDNLAKYIGEYRIHDNNISLRKKDMLRAQLEAILFHQLDKLLPHPEHIAPEVLLSPVEDSPHDLHAYYSVYSEIIKHNRQRKQYPIEALERLLHDNWYTLVMKKGKSGTLSSFLRRPVFNSRYVTTKQLRRAFKQSLKYLLGIRKG